MPRPPRSSPIQVFEDNIADAERLIALTSALMNTRQRRMRRELRETYGRVIGVPRSQWNELDCVESDDVFVVLKPRRAIKRAHFTEPELRPLLRQSIVAISAAVESYVVEKSCSYIGQALDEGEPPERLAKIALSLGDVLAIERSYERRRWGQRAIIAKFLEAEASPNPDKIGRVFSTVGKKVSWGKVDQRRKAQSGSSRSQLFALYERRNRIAHAGDRVGSGRATLELEEVQEHLANAKSIVEALESVL